MPWFIAIKAFAGRIPRQVWIGLGATLLLAGLFFWHQHTAHKALNAAYQRGVDATNAAWRAGQAKADAKQTQRVTVNKQQQASASKDSSDALSNDYAAIDARVKRLHGQSASRQHQGQPSHLPSTGAVASAAQCPAGQDGLPRAVVEPLLIEAARNQAQLNRILEWEGAQQKIADEFAAETVKAEQ